MKRLPKKQKRTEHCLMLKKKGQAKRLDALKQQKVLLDKANRIVHARLLKDLNQQVDEIDNVFANHLRVPNTINDLFDTLFNPSVTYSKIWAEISMISELPKQLTYLVNNPQFCKDIGRSQPKTMIQGRESIGFLGIEGNKVVLPLMIIKNRVKMHSEHFPLTGSKLWSYALICGNTCYHLFKKAGYREPIVGYLLGVSAFTGHIAIYNMFDSVFEQTKHYLMKDLRDRNAMDLYYMIPEIKPSPVILSEVFKQFGSELSLNLYKRYDWRESRYITAAVDEGYNRVNTNERSLHGQVLKQALHFTRFLLLRESKAFLSEHFRPFLHCAFLPNDEIKHLLGLDLKQLNLREFIE